MADFGSGGVGMAGFQFAATCRIARRRTGHTADHESSVAPSASWLDALTVFAKRQADENVVALCVLLLDDGELRELAVAAGV